MAEIGIRLSSEQRKLKLKTVPWSWINPPDFETLFKAGHFFSEKKNKKYTLIQDIYTILIQRASATGSDTKVSNQKLAEMFKVSVKTITRAIKFLEQNKLIAVLRKKTSNGPDGGFKTIRMIRVWVCYYKNFMKPADTRIWASDIRPKDGVEKIVRDKISLKYKVYKNFTLWNKVEKRPQVMTKYSFSNDKLLELGLINQEMLNYLEYWRGLIKTGNRKSLYNVFGYSTKVLITKNTGGFNVPN